MTQCLLTSDGPTQGIAATIGPPTRFVDERRLNVPDQEFTVVMTLENARNIIEAGIAKAKQIGQPMNIAVVDAGANLTAFVRMDGAWLGSIDIAINKAFTAKALISRPWSSAATANRETNSSASTYRTTPG
jgi:uncharacterized protein GlcG (DUF336 family)